jgi:hypothetical protein
MKLVILVFACITIPQYRKQTEDIINTWLKQADENDVETFIIVSNKPSDLKDKHIISIDHNLDDYMSASYKQYKGLKYLCEKINFDFVHVCPCDSYPNILKLKKLCEQYDPNTASLIGGHGDYRRIKDENIYFHSGGPGFILSKKLCEMLYPDLDTITEKWIKLAPNYAPACDLSLAYWCHLHSVPLIVVKGFHHCNLCPKECNTCNTPISETISIHNMKGNDYYQMYRLLSENNFYV